MSNQETLAELKRDSRGIVLPLDKKCRDCQYRQSVSSQEHCLDCFVKAHNIVQRGEKGRR